MLKDLTFNDVCNFIKKEDEKLIDAVNSLLGAAIIFTSLLLGSEAFSFFSILSVKNELISLGKKLLNKITSKEESEYLAKMERMKIAYGLICFTAFFDTLDQELPDDLRKEIDLKVSEKIKIASSATSDASHSYKDANKSFTKKVNPFNTPLPFPHPADTFEKIKEQLISIYEQISNQFGKFIEGLSFYEKADDMKLASLRQVIGTLPNLAINCFEAQYYGLAVKYNEFWVWAQINERDALQRQASDYMKEYYSLISGIEKQIDIGFLKLQRTVLAIPDIFREIKAQEIVRELKLAYEAKVDEPVIEDIEIYKDGRPNLTFPKISEAFIPQSYQALCYSSKDMQLEKKSTWENIHINNDLDAFFVRYLSSPCSIETPLLILGLLGSGKSLLTKVLSARLMCDAYTPIRIPLSEVDPESGVETLVENQIKKDTGFNTISWADFAAQFSDRPLIIILDGFDELLQAKGKVFSAYLDRIHRFQQDQIIHKRPVRVFITSRITLIDKAAVPISSTVLRLMEFNMPQMNTWISIWNSTNADYFSLCDPVVKPFKLPDTGEAEKDNILEMAKQPLLLLMLAIYDSDSNSLHESMTLNRTVLYDSLLRRFIRRERRTYVDGFDSLSEEDQDYEINREMGRLGVAALGMYNRRKLHIHSSELNNDLHFFNLIRNMDVKSGIKATEAEMLLGSFFFVHKSSSGEIKGDSSGRETSFEFLHNTFGEFLTADFILNFALQETETLYEYNNNKRLQAKKLDKSKGFINIAEEWFVCLMYAPLYSRPVIPEMLREWFSHRLVRDEFCTDHFLECFDMILKSHIKMVLESRDFPEIMRTNTVNQNTDMPLIGFLATYTLNLIILRTILDHNEFIFDEDEYCILKETQEADEANTRPWDRLVQLWRWWFKPENLSGLSTILHAERHDRKVILKCNSELQYRTISGQLKTIINAAGALADDTIIGLAGLHSDTYGTTELETISDLEEHLNNEKIDLSFEFLVRRLRYYVNSTELQSMECDELIKTGLNNIFANMQTNNQNISFINLLEIAIKHKCISFKYEGEFFEEYFEHQKSMHAPNYLPKFYDDLICTLLELRKVRWLLCSSHIFDDSIFCSDDLFNMLKSRPALITEWLHLLMELKEDNKLQYYSIEKAIIRFFQPNYLAMMFKMRPDLVVEWLPIIQTFMENELIKQLLEDFFEQAKIIENVENIVILMPKLGIELFHILQKLENSESLKFISDYFFLSDIFPSSLAEISNKYPGLCAEWLHLLQEFRKSTWWEHFIDIFFSTLERNIMYGNNIENSPKLAIEILHLLIKFRGKSWAEHIREKFLRYIDRPLRYSSMWEDHPDLFCQWHRLLPELSGIANEECICNEYFERAVHPSDLVGLLKKNPDSAFKLLRNINNFVSTHWRYELGILISNQFNTDEIVEIINKSPEAALAMIRILYFSGYDRHSDLAQNVRAYWKFDLLMVPFDFINDLRWYALITHDKMLQNDIEYYLKQ